MNSNTVPVLRRFADAAKADAYTAVPDDWVVFISDVVNSKEAIDAGRYKSVNLAGAATISGAANALKGQLDYFIFGGDGASFVVPPHLADVAREALARVAAWTKRDLDLELRVGMVSVADIRAAGHDLRVALWPASDAVNYAMFDGGGMAWADAEVKSGSIRFAAATDGHNPDLTGLSCQWGTVPSRKGKIMSLILRPADTVDRAQFEQIVEAVVAILESDASINPIPPEGPVAELRPDSIRMQFRVPSGQNRLWHRPVIVAYALFAWFVFRTGIRLGDFHPGRYREEIASNTDYRKFDDGLLVTADCSDQMIEQVQTFLDSQVLQGNIRFGLHLQDEALMTCVAPMVAAADHMHFVDGAGGGYAAAARQMSEQ